MHHTCTIENVTKLHSLAYKSSLLHPQTACTSSQVAIAHTHCQHRRACRWGFSVEEWMHQQFACKSQENCQIRAGMLSWITMPAEEESCAQTTSLLLPCMLRQIAGRSTLKPLLNLVVGKLNKRVVLFCKLGGKHVVVLLPYLALSLLHHPFANEPNLAEREQGLVSTHRWREATGRLAFRVGALETELLAPL